MATVAASQAPSVPTRDIKFESLSHGWMRLVASRSAALTALSMVSTDRIQSPTQVNAPPE
jgi:hypothetical protein